jgi:hypothetical protein
MNHITHKTFLLDRLLDYKKSLKIALYIEKDYNKRIKIHSRIMDLDEHINSLDRTGYLVESG